MRGEGPLAGALVFIEVKLRRGTGFGDPLEAVTPKKQTKVRLMAEQYLAKKAPLCQAAAAVTATRSVCSCL
jgi:Holliday junction resolvase-like predicted endonuclease